MPLPSTILYPSGGGGGGTGDVVGPASSTDNGIARFDSTTGKLLQNSAVTIADTTGNMTFPATAKIVFTGNSSYVDAGGGAVNIANAAGTGPAAAVSLGNLAIWSSGFGARQFALQPDDAIPSIKSIATGQFGWVASGDPYGGTLDTALARSAAGIVKVTDGSTGLGGLNVKLGSTSAPAIYSSDLDADTGIYFYSPAGAQYAVAFVSNGSQHGYFGGGCFQVNVPIRWEGNNAGIDKYKTGVLTATNGGIENRAFLGGGTAVASAAALPVPTGRVFHVTGTTGITSITSTNIGHGMVITMIFDDVLTVTDGGNMKLAGDFTTSADDTLTLAYDGTNWYEVCRSVN